MSIGLELVQEHSAETAVEALKRSVAVHATVRRDGHAVPTPVEDIVPGDVVELAAGDFAPADGVVLEAEAAQANDSLLTGEAYPVDKRPGPCSATISAEAFKALFSGTVLVRGTAVMLVTATGGGTRFGAIAAALETAPAASSLERGLHAFGVLIMRMTGFLVLFVLLTQFASSSCPAQFLPVRGGACGRHDAGTAADDNDRNAVAWRGAHGRAQGGGESGSPHRHDLGAMTVLCTDKTGTLTLARIELVGHPAHRRRRQPPRIGTGGGQ